jgi:uncharacterized protein (DUF608 family)
VGYYLTELQLPFQVSWYFSHLEFENKPGHYTFPNNEGFYTLKPDESANLQIVMKANLNGKCYEHPANLLVSH